MEVNVCPQPQTTSVFVAVYTDAATTLCAAGASMSGRQHGLLVSQLASGFMHVCFVLGVLKVD